MVSNQAPESAANAPIAHQLQRGVSADPSLIPWNKQHAALQGAALAFSKRPGSPGLLIKTYSGTNVALAAATKAGTVGQRHGYYEATTVTRPGGQEHRSISSLNETRPQVKDTLYGPLLAARRSVHRESARRRANEPSANAGQERRSASQNLASNVAASLATSRHASHAGDGLADGKSRDASLQHPGSADMIAFMEFTSLPSEGLAKRQDDDGRGQMPLPLRQSKRSSMSPAEAVEADHIPPTAALIGLFESQSNVGMSDDAAVDPEPQFKVSSPTIISPKPVRPISYSNVGRAAALMSKQQLASNRAGLPKVSDKRYFSQPASTGATAVNNSLRRRNASEELKASSDLTARPQRKKPPEADTVAQVGAKMPTGEQLPSPPRGKGDKSPQTASTSVAEPAAAEKKEIPVPLLSRGHSARNDVMRAAPLLGGMSTKSVSSSRTQEAGINELIRSSSTTSSRAFLTPSYTGPGSAMRSSERGLSPYMTTDGLANAIVASSLASSRAPSPVKSQTPSLPRRRSKPHLFSHHHHHHHDDKHKTSRSPSPVKGFRQTMRKPLNSDEEEDEVEAHRRRRSLLNKHPNKHNEGSRKRWRDRVTDRERKRYEGVWAANKGEHVPSESISIRSPQSRQVSSIAAGNVVLNLVVRDIWSRSHLGNDVLEEIWDLVDRRGVGFLDREEFIVGMWLIDQRLKGRKLPIKVSLSVWDSVRAMSGIKIPNRPSKG